MLSDSDKIILREISRHTRRLGLTRFLQNMTYERCLELPLITRYLSPRFGEQLRYLDIGSGTSVYPTYLLRNTVWDLHLVDKFSWVQKQFSYAARVMDGNDWRSRFHVYERDFLQQPFDDGSFDIITNISVIEHFGGDADREAMAKSAALLKKGGLYVLTTPFNGGHYREFFVRNGVYGTPFSGEPVFFQRHYDEASLEDRIITSSGLHETSRVYFGDYGFQCKEVLMNIGWPFKPVKIAYQWATPALASRFGSYADVPVSRAEMDMYTSSGVFVILEKR